MPGNEGRYLGCRFVVVFCWFYLCTFGVFSSIHIQTWQESQGWREMRLCARSFSCIFIVFGLLGPAPPVHPLGFRASSGSGRLGFLLDGTMFSKQARAGKNKAGGWVHSTGFERSHTS